MKRVHFIAIGGSAMHNLAIALHLKGSLVSGSDDEIFEPSKGRLAKHGLLPEAFGWYPEKITKDIDEVILGMHAREDNPELLKAQELGLKIYSYPEYLYEQSKVKTRIVIGGSHGKTSITAMLLHVFQKNNIDVDYMVGAKLDGFDVMVKLTEEAKMMVIEGDEYLTSPIDRRPKFHLYKPHIALISGIAWDHINVFPTFDIYVDQFRQFIHLVEDNGYLTFCQHDEILNKLVQETEVGITKEAYQIPKHRIDSDGITWIEHQGLEYSLKVFGNHNLMNIQGAMNLAKAAGLSEENFLRAIQSFPGASNRLELIAETQSCKAFKDFAHSPSKLKATTSAVKNQFANHELIAVMELHTFSSLNADFLDQYKGSIDLADQAVVYFNPHTIEHKKLPPISVEEVKKAFGRDDLMVITESEKVISFLEDHYWNYKIMLLMTSGNFDGQNLKSLAERLLNQK
jgi:UDP-N-acetylmuramate: L-alanyl-gamma-D-glutamyl-meso-diaminopimelate ligase